MILDFAFLTMWCAIAATIGTSVVVGKMPRGRRRVRIEKRMSRVTVCIGIVSLTLFICALMYV
jgi:hypothetical protein